MTTLERAARKWAIPSIEQLAERVAELLPENEGMGYRQSIVLVVYKTSWSVTWGVPARCGDGLCTLTSADWRSPPASVAERLIDFLRDEL